MTRYSIFSNSSIIFPGLRGSITVTCSYSSRPFLCALDPLNRKKKSYTSFPGPARAPPGEKRSGERSRIPWAYYPKRVMTNEIARLVIITYTFLTTVKFVHLHSSIRTFFERAGRKIFLTLLGYNVAKGCASPRNSTWFTRPFLLVRGWGLAGPAPTILDWYGHCMH